jgi:hypothetical protein
MKNKNLTKGLLFGIIIIFSVSISFGQIHKSQPPISGTGDPGYIPKFITNQSIGNSIIYQKNEKIGINYTNPLSTLDIKSSCFGINIDLEHPSGGGWGVCVETRGNSGVRAFMVKDISTESTVFEVYDNGKTNFYNNVYIHNGAERTILLNKDGKIYCKELKVSLNIPWADYVFSDKHNKLTLGELECYINKNKHLPGLQSSKIIENDMIDLGKMNILLLEKIEEITLYLIELKKENDKIKQEINALKN